MNAITLSDLTLEDLLPHRGNMMFVGEVLEVDNNHAVTLCLVSKTWPMANEKGVHSLILVELAAQTAGVCNGWDRIQSKGVESDQMGWLVGIKKADFLIDLLPFGHTVIGRAENTYKFENLREVSCELKMDDAVVATITLQLFQA